MSIGRVKTSYSTDKEVLEAFRFVSRKEGIIPAFETSHALAYLNKMKGNYDRDDIVVVNFSGRGDKDMETAVKLLEMKI